MLQLEFYGLIARKVDQHQGRGKHLPDHGRESRAEHSPAEHEHKDRVQNCIHDSPGKVDQHGYIWAAVRAHEVRAASGKDQRGIAEGADPHIGRCVVQHILRRTEEIKERTRENQRYGRNYGPADQHYRGSVAYIVARGLILPRTHVEIECGGAADPHQQRDGNAADRQRVADAGRGIA